MATAADPIIKRFAVIRNTPFDFLATKNVTTVEQPEIGSVVRRRGLAILTHGRLRCAATDSLPATQMLMSVRLRFLAPRNDQRAPADLPSTTYLTPRCWHGHKSICCKRGKTRNGTWRR